MTWEYLATQLVEGIVVGFFLALIKDTVLETILIIVIMAFLGFIVFTSPAEIGIAFAEPGLWGWVSFFIGTILGRWLGEDFRKRLPK